MFVTLCGFTNPANTDKTLSPHDAEAGTKRIAFVEENEIDVPVNCTSQLAVRVQAMRSVASGPCNVNVPTANP
jgi:hypothetical protein